MSDTRVGGRGERRLRVLEDVGLALIVIALLASAALGGRDGKRLYESGRLVAHTHEVLAEVQSVVAALTDAETGQRGYLLTADERYLEPYEDARHRLENRLAHLETLTARDETQRNRAEELRKAAAARMAQLNATVALMRERRAQAALETLRNGIGKETMDVIRDIASRMRDREMDLLRLRASEAKRSYRTALGTRILATLLALALVGATFAALRRNLALRTRGALALAAERERLRVTLMSIADAVIVTDEEGRITFLNPVAESLTGRTNAVGAPLADVFGVVDETTGEPNENPVGEALHRGMTTGSTGRDALARSDGARVAVDHSAAPMSVGGRIAGAVLVFRDVTERRQAEAEAKATERRKDEFLATLAHELRGPLSPLRHAVEVLERGGGARGARMSDLIARQVGHMARLVDDLLDVERIRHGKLELRTERTELAPIVQQSVEACRPAIEARGQPLSVALPEERVYLDADSVRLTQVFTNLLQNASKFTPRGGTIRLTVRREGANAIVIVADDGTGIPREMLSTIFDMYAQAGKAREASQQGLGIGLALARSFVEMHFGTIEARSQGPGKGSEFRVVLPAAEKPSADVVTLATEVADLVPRIRAHAPIPRRLLVVDDSEDAAEALVAFLELLGYEARSANGGLAALECGESFRPDAVLLDIGLPHLDGYATAERIRQRPWGADVVLVAVTGWAQEEDRRKAKDAGFDAYLVKPVDALLIERVLPSLLSDRDQERRFPSRTVETRTMPAPKAFILPKVRRT